MSENELTPCKFCGGKVTIKKDMFGKFYVGCVNFCVCNLYYNDIACTTEREAKEAWRNGFAYIGQNSKAKDLKKFGFISATIAINMIYKFSEEFGCSSAERLRIIGELPENVPFIRLGKGKATRRYYRKCDIEEHLSHLAATESEIW